MVVFIFICLLMKILNNVKPKILVVIDNNYVGKSPFTLTIIFYKGYFIANKKEKFFVIGLLINVDPYFLKTFFLFVIFFLLFLIFNKNYLFKIFAEFEIKFVDNLFFLFSLRNILGLRAFYMSFPLWPTIIIFLRFSFWLRRVFNLLKISLINFFKHFAQENLIILITCFIVYIEILSILIRFLTLAFRLLANILGGHLIIELAKENSGNIVLIISLFRYEIFVSLIQAVIYTILIFFYTIESLEKY